MTQWKVSVKNLSDKVELLSHTGYQKIFQIYPSKKRGLHSSLFFLFKKQHDCVYKYSTWSCCMLVWCPRASSAQCLLLFGRLCVCPLRQPAPKLMSPQRTTGRSRSPYPHPHQHWHGNGSKPPSWTHPQIYCHLWTCLWAHGEGVSLTARKPSEGRIQEVIRPVMNCLVGSVLQDKCRTQLYSYFSQQQAQHPCRIVTQLLQHRAKVSSTLKSMKNDAYIMLQKACKCRLASTSTLSAMTCASCVRSYLTWPGLTEYLT